MDKNISLLKAIYFHTQKIRFLKTYDEYFNFPYNTCILKEINSNTELISNIMKFEFVTIFDENYPEKLKLIISPPPIIFYKGDISLLISETILAFIGSRKASIYGENVSRTLLQNLNAYEFVSISGLALGIDTFAHEFSIDNNIKTIAVLGSGISQIYPRTNQKLADKIIEKGGLIISEFLPETPAYKYNFPWRNRLIAGLSKAVIVIEAQIQSGTTHTATWAIDSSIDVYAVPGSILSQNCEGTNQLILSGAHPLINAELLIHNLSLKFKMSGNNKSSDLTAAQAEGQSNVDLFCNNTQREIINVLSNGPLSINSIISLTNLSIQEISIALTDLTIKRIVNKHFGNFYSLISFK